MANQKASTLIVPDKQFEALQTTEGNSLVFSIGTDGIFYCAREVPGDTHGWVRVNLNPTLAQLQADIQTIPSNAVISAKTFDIAQDMVVANSVDIALIITVAYNNQQEDYLYMATGFTNTLANWAASTPPFSFYGFDYPGDLSFKSLPINDVQILDSNEGNATQYIIADVITDAATLTISRFYVDVTKQNKYAWLPHDLSSDLQAGKITTFLGCGPNDGPDTYLGADDGLGNNIGGAYVLGTLAGKPQLQYTPAYNINHPEETPDPTVFNFPAGTNAAYMAMDVSCPASSAPYTDLFFASNGQLFFLACADQNDSGISKPTPVSIYTHNLFQNVQSLHVKNWDKNIVIWGQSLDPADMKTSRLFIMEGVAGQETNAAAWSCPIPLLFDVVNSSAYVNKIHSLVSSIDPTNGNAYGSCNVLFAEQVVKKDDGTYSSVLTQLFQDPVTSAWQTRSLLTAPTPENVLTEIYDTTTYSTHIEITDDSNLIQPNVPVAVWASSPCSVYITDASNTAAYHTLDTVKPLNLTSDFSGNIAIMQPVDTIGGISYYVAVQDPTSKQIYTEVINPLSGTSGTIATLNSKVPDGNKDYLQGVQVTDEYGHQTQLVSNTYNSSTANTSNNINTICQQNVHMNTDGLVSGQSWPDATTVAAAFSTVQSVATKPIAAAASKPGATSRVKHNIPTSAKNRVKKLAKADRRFKDLRFNPKTDKIWGWTYGKNAAHYEGIEAVKAMGVLLNTDGSLSLTSASTQLGSGLHIEAKLGHIVKWMKSEANKLTNVLVTFANGVVDCVLTIAGDFYHFVAKCANDIVNLVHTVLNAIETAFKDLVAWIGMLFNFQDILTTHAVLKNIINIYISYTETNFDKLGDYITNLFTALESQIDAKTGLPSAGLPSSTQTYSAAMATGTPPSGSKSPSANYGTHHMKNNAGNSTNGHSSDYSPLESIFADILTAAQNEGDAFNTLGAQIKTIAENLPNQPFTTTLSQVLGAIADLALSSAENFLQLVVEVMEAVLSEVKDVLNATIDIPVISYLYRKMTGSDLTPLDLFCLLSAIPATVVYKAVKQQAPFSSSNPSTIALLNATDITSLQQAVNALPTLSSVEASLLGHGDTGKTTLNIISSIAAGVGAVVIDFCVILKSTWPRTFTNPVEVFANKVISVIQGVGFMGYVLPDMVAGVQQGGLAAYTIDTWFEGMNNLCTYLAVVKAIVDSSSPWWPAAIGDPYGQIIGPAIDCFLNVAWQFPTVFELLHQLHEHGKFVPADINAIVSCIGGTAFDLSGILSPFYSYTFNFSPQSPIQKGVVLGLAVAISGCNLIWGGSCLATTFDGLPVPS